MQRDLTDEQIRQLVHTHIKDVDVKYQLHPREWIAFVRAIEAASAALASAPAAEPYREHLADQADAIDLERLAKALTVMGCAGPAGQEDCGARIAEMVNRLTSAVERFGRDFRASHPQAQVVASCGYCDGTGDVHSIDGQWRGECTECDAAQRQGGGNATS